VPSSVETATLARCPKNAMCGTGGGHGHNNYREDGREEGKGTSTAKHVKGFLGNENVEGKEKTVKVVGGEKKKNTKGGFHKTKVNPQCSLENQNTLGQ